MAKQNLIRNCRFDVRLTEVEYENVKAKADYCNMNMSEYIRKQIMDGVVIKYERLDIKALANEINKIGVNLNQISKHINEKGGDYDRQDFEKTMKEFEELKSVVYSKVWGID